MWRAGCKETHCCPESLVCWGRGGIVCVLQSQVFNFHETLFLQEEWLMLLLICSVKLHGRVTMQKSLVLVDGFPHDKSIRLLQYSLMTDHPVPSSLICIIICNKDWCHFVTQLLFSA